VATLAPTEALFRGPGSRSEFRPKLSDRPLEEGRHGRLHFGVSPAREHFVSFRFDRFDLLRGSHADHYARAGYPAQVQWSRLSRYALFSLLVFVARASLPKRSRSVGSPAKVPCRARNQRRAIAPKWARDALDRYRRSPMASTRTRPEGWRPLAPEVAQAFMSRLVREYKARDALRAALVALDAPTHDDARTVVLVLLEALEAHEGVAAKAVRAFARSRAKLVPSMPPHETRTQKIDRLRASLRVELEAPEDHAREEVRRLAPWWLATGAVATWQMSTAPGTLQIDEGLPLRFLARVALRIPKRSPALVALAHATLALHAFRATPDEPEGGWDAATTRLCEAIAPEWLAARATKTIAGAGVDWFVDRAIEAMGEEPRTATAADRQRRSRARRSGSKM
jgi:hypothetical protein